jgi:hypothetical protein
MQQEVDVLDMVIRLVCALGVLLGLTRVDALENAEAPVRSTERSSDQLREEEEPRF